MDNGKLVPQTLPLSFYVVSPFQIIPSYSGVFPKGLSSNSSIGFPEIFPLFPFMPLPLQDFSLFFAQKFMLQSLDDLGMFLLEPLAPFRKRIYITCKSQEDYRAHEIEEIIADHNILILKDLSESLRRRKYDLGNELPIPTLGSRFQSRSLNESTCRRKHSTSKHRLLSMSSIEKVAASLRNGRFRD